MSLRTKLLAVFVGLPGAILLLALMLFIRAEPSTPLEAVGRLIRLGKGTNIQTIGPDLMQEVEARSFRQIYVIQDAGQDPERHPSEIWTARAFYAPELYGKDAKVMPPSDVTDAGMRERVMRWFRAAQRLFPPWDTTSSHVAVVLDTRPDDGEDQRGYGVVAEVLSPRSGARTVYWVMIGGIALIMILSYVVVSRLVVRPLERLSAAADRIADGDYDIAVEGEEGGDEVGRTVRALNRMAREIAEYQGHLEDRVLSALGRIKNAEKHLVIAQRLSATGKLASGLAHEINNPLGGMKNAVRALARGDLSPERTQLYLDLIADGLARVEQTVKKFLSFTPRMIEPHPVDLADVAQKSVALAMHKLEKQRVSVETSLPAPGEAIVFGDPHELQQVALNLLLNAADAIEEGKDGHLRVTVERNADEVVMAITDDGTGMSAEDQDRCFDMFFTTKAVGEGSGMGLAVVHNIVTNHGGRIELTSALGEGTTFQVFLPGEPSADAKAAETPSPASPAAPSGEGGRAP